MAEKIYGWLLEVAIEPKSESDQEKLGVALAKLMAEDPSFRANTDQESGQTILTGMGELHLDIKVDILKHLQGRGQSARRRWPIARRSRARSPRTTPTRSRLVAPASTPR